MQTFQQIVLVFAFISLTFARPSTNKSDKRLIKFSEEEPAKWISQADIETMSLSGHRIHFIDITDRNYPFNLRKVTTKAIPAGPNQQPIVQNAISKINVQGLETFVSEFDNFPNRYYAVQNGVDAAAWLINQVRDVIASVPNYPGTVSVSPFNHSWLQPSTIARIEGSDPTLKREVVIFGAHMDSINLRNNAAGVAPGADDNGSGSVTVLETLRVLLVSGFVPKRTIEFQWYAAEEVGLRGSGDIAESYYDQEIDVVAMVNFDVVGYNPKGNRSIVLLTDNTNAELNAFLRKITDEYLAYSWEDNVCGYGCSDHASFTNYGFPATCSSEIDLSPFMHTVHDTIDTVDFNQVAEFVKLAVASAIEIGEPSS